DIDSKAFQKNTLDVNTFNGFLYSAYDGCAPWYVNTLLSLAYHDYNSVRNIYDPVTFATPIISTRADGDFDAWQFMAFGEIGYDFTNENWVITPHLNATYSNLDIGGFQETGAGPYNLNVQYDDVSEAVLGGGLRVAYVIKYEDGVKIIPSLY